ncbi:MAG: hypothetical protein LBU64_12725, partial [Planctomycetota bacterium]|nr:hypothetical protein [Planctomycetota bacterium]
MEIIGDEASSLESRADLMGAGNLFEYFCLRTAGDMRTHGRETDSPTTSFAGLLVTFLAAAALFIFGKPQLAKAVFALFGVILLWTAWTMIIRASERIEQKADDIRAGMFPPSSSPLVLARLKWWNHLLAPLRWGRHSRLYDRRSKLERRIAETGKRLAELAAAPPSPEEAGELADRISTFRDRSEYELRNAAVPDEAERVRGELLLLLALRRKLDGMAEKLEGIEKLGVVFQSVNPEDLSQVVSEAIQLLEERRLLVAAVDRINPEDFIDLVTVRT